MFPEPAWESKRKPTEEVANRRKQQTLLTWVAFTTEVLCDLDRMVPAPNYERPADVPDDDFELYARSSGSDRVAHQIADWVQGNLLAEAATQGSLNVLLTAHWTLVEVLEQAPDDDAMRRSLSHLRSHTLHHFGADLSKSPRERAGRERWTGSAASKLNPVPVWLQRGDRPSYSRQSDSSEWQDQ